MGGSWPRPRSLASECGQGILHRMSHDYAVSQSESDREEWKAGPTGEAIERGMQTVCAFLNSYGGKVIFGVGPDGKDVTITGDLDQLQLAITNHLQNHISPNARAFIEVSTHSGRIYVFVKPDLQHIYTHKQRVYRRVGTATLALDFQQAKELEKQRTMNIQEHAPGFFTQQKRGEHLRCKNGHEVFTGGTFITSFGGPPPEQMCEVCGEPLRRA